VPARRKYTTEAERLEANRKRVREAMRRMRANMTPEEKAQENHKSAAYQTKRYAADPAFRDRQRAAARERKHARVYPLRDAIVAVVKELPEDRLPAIVAVLKAQAKVDADMRQALQAYAVDHLIGHLLEPEAEAS
jgi:hypothetical protein